MNKFTYFLITTIVIIVSVLFLAYDKAIEAANIVLTVLEWSVIAIAVLLPIGTILAGGLFALWFIANRAIDTRQKWLETKLQETNIMLAEKEANAPQVITAEAGKQVYLAGAVKATQALHLQQSYYAVHNDNPTPVESMAWAGFNTLYAPSQTKQAGKQVKQKDDITQVKLPDTVSLLTLGKEEGFSLDKIFFGKTIVDNKLTTVSIPLKDAVNIGALSSIGFGKSSFIQAILYQLAMAQANVEIGIIDEEGVTSAPFRKLNKLRYPVASTPSIAIEIIDDLHREMLRRQKLLAKSKVTNHIQFNELEKDNSLSTIFVAFDEVTSTLSHKALHDKLADNIIQLRKTGIYFLLAGQQMGSGDMRPIIRRQLVTRVVYSIGDYHQAYGFGIGAEATKLRTKGRAWAILPGQQKMLLQTPYIAPNVIEGQLASAGKLDDDMPFVEFENERERKIYNLLRDNPSLSYRKIATKVGLKPSSYANKIIKKVAQKHGLGVK